MNIWIDLANSPHVIFFHPIILELQARGHTVVVTLRQFSQTVELARLKKIEGTTIGGHGGKNNLPKIFNLFRRSKQLYDFIKKYSIDIAVSHNSYSHSIAGRLIGAKVVTIMDYEGQPANHIAFRAASNVIVPDFFPDDMLRKYGARKKRVYKYKGFKEQVYLSDFRYDPLFETEIIKACKLPVDWRLKDNVLVTIRTPPSTAAYHNFTNDIFEVLLERLSGHSNTTVILLARNESQRQYYKKRFPALFYPDVPLSGNQLVYCSDVLISAGGTMNREAAILGTPVFTVFAGKLPAADVKLIEMGRMSSIKSQDEISNIRLEKKKKAIILDNPDLCREIVQQIVL